MRSGLQLSARSVAGLLAQIFGPSIYDVPRFGGGDPIRAGLIQLAGGPQLDPANWVMLNPQPLPPRELYALALADAHIREIQSHDRMATLLGGRAAERALERSVRQVAEIEELCPPRWPRWPKLWPPPPPPPWSREEMTPTESFVFGARILAAAELMDQVQLQEALAGLGEKALDASMQG